jgi:hypothetical protein
MTEIDPELLDGLMKSPFVTVEPGDTVILVIGDEWEPEQIESLGTHLDEWAPRVRWRAVNATGFTGVIHIKGTASTTG